MFLLPYIRAEDIHIIYHGKNDKEVKHFYDSRMFGALTLKQTDQP